MANITGTSGNDPIDNTTTGNDTVDALAGNDTITGSSGTDVIDGGADYDTLVFTTSDATYFNPVAGPQTFTIGATTITDTSGDINTTYSNIEAVTFSVYDLPILAAGQQHIIDASGFTGVQTTLIAGPNDTTVIGSPAFDLIIGVMDNGTNIVADGGAGSDYFFASFPKATPETITVTDNGMGSTVFTSSLGETMSAQNIGAFAIATTGQADKTFDWSALGTGFQFRDNSTPAMNSDDVIIAGSGLDFLYFGYGSDSYTGNGGGNIYLVSCLWDSANSVGARWDGDSISDFTSGDLIDFTQSFANDPFTAQFIGTAAFTGGVAGEIRYEKSGGQTLLQSDGDGDGTADATLTIANGEFDLRAFGPGQIALATGAGVNHTGTAGPDFIDQTTPYDDTVDGLAGDDHILGSSGTDVIDGGDDWDLIDFSLSDWSRFDYVAGPRTFTIGAGTITDGTGDIDTSFSNVEHIYLSTIGLPDPGAGTGYTVDASGFGGQGGVNIQLYGTVDNVTGSGSDDNFHVRGGMVNIDAGGGMFDYLNFEMVGAGTETVTASIGGMGEAILTSSSGAILSAQDVETFGFINSNNGPKVVDWSALSIRGEWQDWSWPGGFTDDTVTGGSADDYFDLGWGSDTYTGGLGADFFATHSLWDAGFGVGASWDGDVITDLDPADTISFFNAFANDPVTPTFIGMAAFSGTPGEVRYVKTGGQTLVQSDGDGDGNADATLTVSNGEFDLRQFGQGILQISTGAGVNHTGTTGPDFVDQTTPYNDTVDGLAGDDFILGSSGTDSIDGGADFDVLQFDLTDTSRIDFVGGPRTVTIDGTTVTDGSGTLDTTFTNVEQVIVGTLGLPALPPGQGHLLDGSAFTGPGGVRFNVGGTNDVLLGSAQGDIFTVNGGFADITGDAGYDEVEINLQGSSSETVTFTSNNPFEIDMVSSNGDGFVAFEIERFVVFEGVESGKTLDWSSTSAPVSWLPNPNFFFPTIDQLSGGSGDDYFEFDYGLDTFSSGTGDDYFAVNSLWNAGAGAGAAFDGATITDFDGNDVLGFYNVMNNDPQPATFIGQGAFSMTAGEVRYGFSGGMTLVQSDGDGDGLADAELTIANGEFHLVENFPGSMDYVIDRQAGVTYTGTPGGDWIDFTGTGDDTINALAGEDVIFGSSGTDLVDGGADNDILRYEFNMGALLNPVFGPETFTIGATTVTSGSGDIATTHNDIERIEFNAYSLPILAPGDQYVFDASGFTGSNGVQIGTQASDALITGSASNDLFISVVQGGTNQVDVDGGSGFDVLVAVFNNTSPETITVQGNGMGGITLDSSLGDSIFIENVAVPVITGNGSSDKTFDWSSIGANINFQAIGPAANYVVIAGSGNDTFLFGAGNDTYTGGAGTDTYQVDTLWDFGTGSPADWGGDVITDLAQEDRINFAGLAPGPVPAFIGTAAFSGTAGELRFEKTGGQTLLHSDGDGDGFADATLTIANGEFDLIETVPGILQPYVTPMPTSGDDILLGFVLPDVIDGLAGNDKIFGFEGDDTLDGNLGNDALIGDDNAFSPYAGNDTLNGGPGGDLLIGGAGNDILNGGDDDDFIIAGQGTAYNLNPGLLWDWAPSISSDSGNDTIDGGPGTDRAIVTLLRGLDIQYDISNPGAVSPVLVDGVQVATVTGLEALTIYTDSGNDTLIGGLLEDTFYPGSGDDFVDGGAGNDNVGYSDAPGGVKVRLIKLGSPQDTLSAGIDTLVSIENVFGSAFDDILRGDGNANLLSGSSGADELRGGPSDDTLQGGPGDDTILGGGGIDTGYGGDDNDTIRTEIAWGDAGDDMIRIAAEAHGGGGDDDLRATPNGAASLYGDADNDSLLGGLKNDTLDGGTGDDFLRGGEGKDVHTGGTGADTFRFNEGEVFSNTTNTDRITDFNEAEGDKINLKSIDAIAGGADDPFTFIGNAAFSSTAGELRWEQNATNTFLMGDTTGNGVEDFMIRLDGLVAISGAGLVL